jgi:hypothetical protein
VHIASISDIARQYGHDLFQIKSAGQPAGIICRFCHRMEAIIASPCLWIFVKDYFLYPLYQGKT